MLQQYDEVIAAGATPHRVTTLFCGHGQHSFRPALQAYALGDAMTPELSAEVAAYERCILDDTWGERAHAMVSKRWQKTSYVSPGRLCAELRFPQNMAAWDKLQEPGQHDALTMFERKLWPAFRAIGQRKRFGKLRVPRIKRDVLLDRVYHTSVSALKPWTAMFQTSPLFAITHKRKSPGADNACRLNIWSAFRNVGSFSAWGQRRGRALEALLVSTQKCMGSRWWHSPMRR